MPPLAALVVLAPDFVPVVLGDQWSGRAGDPDPRMGRDRPGAPEPERGRAHGARPRSTIFRFSLVLVSCHLVAFIVGLHWGVVGVAAAFAVSTTLVEPFQSVLAARALGVSPMVFVHGVAGVFQAAAGMCLIVLGVRLGLVDAGVHEALRLVICTGVGVLAYAALCAVAGPGAGSRRSAACSVAAAPLGSGWRSRRRRRVLTATSAAGISPAAAVR